MPHPSRIVISPKLIRPIWMTTRYWIVLCRTRTTYYIWRLAPPVESRGSMQQRWMRPIGFLHLQEPMAHAGLFWLLVVMRPGGPSANSALERVMVTSNPAICRGLTDSTVRPKLIWKRWDGSQATHQDSRSVCCALERCATV